MIKENKLKVIISSLVTLLPILIGICLWDKLPENMITHIGADGNADGEMTKIMAVFMLPLICLAIHCLCLFLTSIDKGQKNQNRKALGIIFWILPATSLFSNGTMYAIALKKELNLEFFFAIALGIMFIYMGNYLPKVKQNHTLGIKMYWTLANEENWNKTHRLAGKVWVIGGLVILVSALLPVKMMITLFLFVLIVLMAVPTIYSYCLYRAHKDKGIEYDIKVRTKADKIGITITAILIPIILLGVGVVMFTGDIVYTYNEDTFFIEASFGEDLEIEYEKIEKIEYRKEFDVGTRRYGFASAKISLGTFKNDEFGSYILYANTGKNGAVVLEIEGEKLVLIGDSIEETKEIYNQILSRVSK